MIEAAADTAVAYFVMGLVLGVITVIVICSGWRDGIRTQLWRAGWALDWALNDEGHIRSPMWREETTMFLRKNRRIYKPTDARSGDHRE